MAKNKDLMRIFAKLDAIPEAIRQQIKPELVKGAEEIATYQRGLAELSRDTGALIDSITVTAPGERTPPYSQPGGSQTVPKGAVMITAGNSDVRYPHLVEYGTSLAEAQPFFWPGYKLGRQRAVNRINRAGRKIVRSVWNKGTPQKGTKND